MGNNNDGLRTIEQWFVEPSKRAKRRERNFVIGFILFAAAYFLIEIIQAYMEGRFPCPK